MRRVVAHLLVFGLIAALAVISILVEIQREGTGGLAFVVMVYLSNVFFEQLAKHRQAQRDLTRSVASESPCQHPLWDHWTDA